MAEGPYKLPKGWRWVRLGEVAQIFSGTWGKDPELTDGKNRVLARVIRVSDIKETLVIDYDNVPLRSVGQREVKRFALRDGDIVVVKSSGSKAKVISGRAALFRQQKEAFIPSNFVFAVRSEREFIHPVFLWHWLNSKPAKQYIEQIVSTFTYPNLKKSDYVDLPVPLPPLSEQRRIVARVEELLERVREAKRLREEAKKDADRLWQSVLAETFPKPGEELPPGWKWVRLGEVCRTQSGNSKLIKGRLHKQPGPGRYPGFSASGQDVWLDHYEHEGHAIILSAVGARCGKCFLAKGKWSAIANTHIIWSDESRVDLHYLYHLLNNEDFWVRGQSAQPFVKVSETKKKLIPLPPLSEQRRIVAYLDQIHARVTDIKKAQEATEAELHRLEQAILDKAFRGEL